MTNSVQFSKNGAKEKHIFKTLQAKREKETEMPQKLRLIKDLKKITFCHGCALI